MLFNKTEEVKVSVPREPAGLRLRVYAGNRELGLIVIARSTAQKELNAANTSSPVTMSLGFSRAQGYRVKRISACGGCLGDYRR